MGFRPTGLCVLTVWATIKDRRLCEARRLIEVLRYLFDCHLNVEAAVTVVRCLTFNIITWQFINSHCISIFTMDAESSPTVTNSPTLSTFYNSFHSSNQKLQNVWSTPSRLGNNKSRQNTAARIDVDCCSVQI